MKAVKLITLFILFAFSFQVIAQTEVYVTKTGKKYHKENCRYLKVSKNKTIIKKAKAKGYLACKVCVPKEKGVKSKAVSDRTTKKVTKKKYTSTKKNIASRCRARTQKGTQCKRRTKNASGKCWQH
ncbi:MAG: hypothetical protein ACI9WV_000843 [Patiriisocius sp.]|jgi:hypothetical protein